MSEAGARRVRTSPGHSKEGLWEAPGVFILKTFTLKKEPSGYTRQVFTWQEWFANGIKAR